MNSSKVNPRWSLYLLFNSSTSACVGLNPEIADGNVSVIKEVEEEYSEDVGEIVNFNFEEDEQINSEQFNDCLWLAYKDGLEKEKQTLLDKLDSVSSEEKREIMAKVMQISQRINNRSME